MNMNFHASLFVPAIVVLFMQGGIAPPPPPGGAPVPVQNTPQPTPPIPLPHPATRPAAGKEPKIVVEKTDFDFGVVDEGRIFDTVSPFRNEGKGALVITQAQPGCGCTDVVVEVEGRPYTMGDPILPGSKGFVRGRVKTEGFGGQDKHTGIKLNTNDPSVGATPDGSFGTVDIKIHLNIQKRFVCDPPDNLINMEMVPSTEAREKSIIFKNTKGEPFQIIGFEPIDPLLEMRAEAMDATASSYRIVATLNPGSPFGPFVRQVRILTKPESPPFTVTVQGTVHGPVSYEPMQVHFTIIPKGRTAVKLIQLRNTDSGHTMKLENVRFLDPNDKGAIAGAPAREHEMEFKKHLVVNLKPGKNENEATVEVVVADTMPIGSFHTILSIKTGVPGTSPSGSDEMRIPVTGIVK